MKHIIAATYRCTLLENQLIKPWGTGDGQVTGNIDRIGVNDPLTFTHPLPQPFFTPSSSSFYTSSICTPRPLPPSVFSLVLHLFLLSNFPCLPYTLILFHNSSSLRLPHPSTPRSLSTILVLVRQSSLSCICFLPSQLSSSPLLLSHSSPSSYSIFLLFLHLRLSTPRPPSIDLPPSQSRFPIFPPFFLPSSIFCFLLSLNLSSYIAWDFGWQALSLLMVASLR